MTIPISLYIHIPWCVRKCPYCDFNSHAQEGELPEKKYVDALIQDLSADFSYLQGRRFCSVFIGGGTPSLLSASAIDRLLTFLDHSDLLEPQAEITLEANPGTFEQEKFSLFRQAGVNRLSIGIQSLNDHQLQMVGRIHSAQEAIRAVKIARQAGFGNLNLDLMFGLPEQSLEQAIGDIEQAIELQPDHISYYQLTLEPNTYFHRFPPVLPDEDGVFRMQEEGQKRLAEAGYRQYEVSAYAKPERESLHNRNYWEFGDYIGIGAGAHGKVTLEDGQILRTWKYKQPAEYMQKVAQSPTQGSRVLDKKAISGEFMLNALRLKDGFDINLFLARTGMPISDIQHEIDEAIAKDLLIIQDGKIRPTALGWSFLNDAISIFL